MLSSLMLRQDSKTGLLSLERLVNCVFVGLLNSTHVAILPSTFLYLFSSSGVLYHPKAHSQSTPVLKIHFNYKDKSIYVSGYGLLDARKVSSVALEGDKLSIISGNVTYNWASSVSSAT